MLLGVFVAYLVIVLGLGVWSMKRSKTQSEYILGGRRIPGTALALSERATGESAWLLLGLTGHAYAEGLSCIWTALGCVIGILFIWFAMSRRLREETERTGALTVPGLISRRFPGSEKAVGLLSAFVIIFFFLFYIAAQFAGAGTVLQSTFGIAPFWGTVIGAVVVTLYCFLGGFIAVVVTDVFQSVLMIFTLVVLPVIGLFALAGDNLSIASALREAGPALSTVTAGKTGFAAVLFVLSGLSWMFGYTGQPQLLTRMMAMRSDADVKRARWTAAVWTILAYAGALLIGMIAFATVSGGVLSEPEAGPEGAMPMLALFLLSPLLAGICLSGAISAMMSTADSELLVCSSSASEDVYATTAKRRMSPGAMLRLTRLLTLGVGALAFILAVSVKDTVFGLVSYAWSGLGSSFGPVLLLLLFWKGLSRAGVFASLISGTLGTVVWKNFFLVSTGVSERLASFVFAFLMAVVFSLLMPEWERTEG
ncbi:sodium/proline symporter [Candidatus Fermentibacteria bacterium]|nr:sodium/proline symporter [Candidatus Fermentibacteria bacterium]